MKKDAIIKYIGIFCALTLAVSIITTNIITITGISLMGSGGTVAAPAGDSSGTPVANTTAAPIGGGSITPTAAATNAQGTTAASGTPAGTTKAPSGGSQSGGDATTAAPAQSADGVPVNGSVADIVAYYNKAANDTKKYSGKVDIKRTSGTTTTLDEISISMLRGTAEGMLPNDYPTEKTGTYTNGVDAEGNSINKMLPPDNQEYGSQLTAAGVLNAACTPEGSDYKVVITLVSETGNDINFKPPHHGSCIDTLNITAEDIAPFTLNEATITYTGATITAVINSDGLLKTLDIQEPVGIDGKLAYKSFNLITAKISGNWQQQFVLTY